MSTTFPAQIIPPDSDKRRSDDKAEYDARQAEASVVYEDGTVVVFMDLNPVTPGRRVTSHFRARDALNVTDWRRKDASPVRLGLPVIPR